MEQPPRIPQLILQIYHFTRRAFDEAVRVHGVSAPQFAVLNRVADKDDRGVSGAELARLMFTTPQAAHLMLTTLEKKRLVARRPDPGNARIVLWTLTEQGRLTMDRCRADAGAVERRLVGVLEPEERIVFADLLQRFMRQAPGGPDVSRA